MAGGEPRPRISVVTVCRNPGALLRGCLESVAAQGLDDVEHVIIDGASGDGTVDLLRGWDRHPIAWVSEPDRGISHAFAKGLARATGEVIGLLNADDRYTPGALARGLAALDTAPGAGFAFGHCLHRERDGRTWLNYADPAYRSRLATGMPDVNHPTMLVRRSAYDRVGGYDERWSLAMDYDWLIRAERAGVHGVLVDAVQAEMAMGGVSDRRWAAGFAEVRAIAITHGAPRWRATAVFAYRLAKGGVRRVLVRLGARAAEHRLRRWRQRRIVGR